MTPSFARETACSISVIVAPNTEVDARVIKAEAHAIFGAALFIMREENVFI